MSTTTERPTAHYDFLIVGAGISGIGMAVHLSHRRPGCAYTVLEARDTIGGTWDLFRFPGIRSDSDLPTFGYRFKPWTGDKMIAPAPDILAYLHETIDQYDVRRHIRFGHRVESAAWDSDEGRWTVHALDTESGERVVLTAKWLLSGTGYYRYDQGYSPEFPGSEDFQGTIVHPQFWPADLDYTDKRVVVIGSGATAVTIVPAMTGTAKHVTQLQRSPSYVFSLPAVDRIANGLRRLLGDARGHQLTRRKNVRIQELLYKGAQRYPRAVRWIFRALAKLQLPRGYDVDVHFNPTYDPWDQRLCIVPDGDLFKAVKSGGASIVTDRIERFDATGIQLVSGKHLDADIIVTATGLNLIAFGGIPLSVDGEDVVVSQSVVYNGMMLGNVPNFAFVFGYVNASWTLKVDIVCDYLCRLLDHLEATGHDVAVPVPDPDMPTAPFIDFEAGYVQRAIHEFPRVGDRSPWELSQDYVRDAVVFRERPVDDGIMRFSRTPEAERAEVAVA